MWGETVHEHRSAYVRFPGRLDRRKSFRPKPCCICNTALAEVLSAFSGLRRCSARWPVSCVPGGISLAAVGGEAHRESIMSLTMRCGSGVGALAALLAIASGGWAADPAVGPLELQLKPAAPRRFERVEIVVQGTPAAANPFDPDSIALDLDVTSASGRKVRVP